MTTAPQPGDLGGEPIGKVLNPNSKPHPSSTDAAESLLEAFYAEFVTGLPCEARKAAGQ